MWTRKRIAIGAIREGVSKDEAKSEDLHSWYNIFSGLKKSIVDKDGITKCSVRDFIVMLFVCGEILFIIR